MKQKSTLILIMIVKILLLEERLCMKWGKKNELFMIVIKTEELNYLIYSYFLEQGYSHSAFALANEVKVDLQKYRDDVKPGQLVNNLEKALLFSQLQDHIQMNQYYECKVPTYLIQKHVCQFTEKRQQAEK